MKKKLSRYVFIFSQIFENHFFFLLKCKYDRTIHLREIQSVKFFNDWISKIIFVIQVEHSTVKIKSNIPPCLPPVDPQTQAKPVPEKCKQNKREPDHVNKHKTKERIECVDLNESVDENDSVESSSTAKPEKSTDSAKPKEPSEPANHDTVDDSEVNDEEGVTEVTEVTGGSEDEDEDEEYVKDTKETPNLEPISGSHYLLSQGGAEGSDFPLFLWKLGIQTGLVAINKKN